MKKVRQKQTNYETDITNEGGEGIQGLQSGVPKYPKDPVPPPSIVLGPQSIQSNMLTQQGARKLSQHRGGHAKNISFI